MRVTCRTVHRRCGARRTSPPFLQQSHHLHHHHHHHHLHHRRRHHQHQYIHTKCFFNCSSQFPVPKWKKSSNPRATFSRNIQCKTSLCWLNKFFSHFGTENWEEQLKNTLYIILHKYDLHYQYHHHRSKNARCSVSTWVTGPLDLPVVHTSVRNVDFY